MQLERAITWSKDERRLYVVGRVPGSGDAREHAFAIDVASGAAWQIGPTDLSVASVSVTDAGDVALTVNAERGRIGSLWILPASSVRESTPGAAHLGHCPPMEPLIADFVRRANLPSVHWIEPIYEDSARQLTVFSVAYGGACDIYSTRTGVRYGSRVGWIELDDLCQSMEKLDSMHRNVPWFLLRSSDSYLFSDTLAALLKGGKRADEFWSLFVLRQPATPFDVIVREVRNDPHRLALVALDNPTVRNSDAVPFEARLRLGALEDTLAAAMVTLPDVRSNPERLVAITDLPYYRTGEGLAAMRVEQQLQALIPLLVAKVEALSERAAVHAYMAGKSAGNPDTMGIALLHGPFPERRKLVLALETVRTWESRPRDSAFARAVLARLGSTPEHELLAAVQHVRNSSQFGSLPELMLSDYLHMPWPVLEAITRLDERFRHSRNRAAIKLASEPSAPDSILEVLANGLSHGRDPVLAERLLQRHPFADTSRALLRALGAMEQVQYGVVAKQARERLARLELQGAPTSAPLEPLPPPPTPTRSAPRWSGEYGQTDQCLAPDSWSEQLGRSIGVEAELLAGDSLCIRAAAALDRAFELAERRDSAYVFGVMNGFVLAFPPARPDADVTLVRFDSAFVERSRRVVQVQ